MAYQLKHIWRTVKLRKRQQRQMRKMRNLEKSWLRTRLVPSSRVSTAMTGGRLL